MADTDIQARSVGDTTAASAPGGATSRVGQNQHGAIGDMGTVALVSLEGSVDFLCWPHFDSPSIFTALLDSEKGGAFSLRPELNNARALQLYRPDSNVLVTRWLSDQGSAEIVDLMALSENADKHEPRLIRRIQATRGKVPFRMSCTPRMDYGRIVPQVKLSQHEARFHAPDCPDLALRGPLDFQAIEGGVQATFSLEAGQSLCLVLSDASAATWSEDDVSEAVDETTRYWQTWMGQSTYRGRWRDAVNRSALILKLLTSQRYGSIIAAPTFGMPEVLGGERNWDYRASWVRDASFSVYGLMRLGYQKEAIAFGRWINDRAQACDEGHLKVMYAVDGSDVGDEESLTHLDGFMHSRPVRAGNAAATQLQLDNYGALLDSIYLSNKYGEAISHADWTGAVKAVNYVCENWFKPDAGIWEDRGEPKENLHSRLMCWVAVDRALRLADKRSLAMPFSRWMEVRTAIHDDIWANFWNAEVGHFVRHKGSRQVDGALLQMPLVRFIGATDPAWLSTLTAIGEQLSDDALVFRYCHDDSLKGQEGAFAACAFWYVECLARAGQLDKARMHFEKLLQYGDGLQLFAEEFDRHGQPLGNFPQAFTHLALISAAYCLDRLSDSSRPPLWPA